MNLSLRIHAHIDWFWSTPSIGFNVAAYLGKECTRWFRVSIDLLFLRLGVRIDGQEREFEEDHD